MISGTNADDADIQREITNYMFVRTNILLRRFSLCSNNVKTVLYKTYCLCMYDAALRYDTRCYFNVRSKADISQLNLPHGTDN